MLQGRLNGIFRAGRLVVHELSGFWSPSLTVTDPEIPWLPLESPVTTRRRAMIVQTEK